MWTVFVAFFFAFFCGNLLSSLCSFSSSCCKIWMIKESSAYFHVKNKKEDLMETADLMEKSSRSYRLHALSEKPEPDNIAKSPGSSCDWLPGISLFSFILFSLALHQKSERTPLRILSSNPYSHLSQTSIPPQVVRDRLQGYFFFPGWFCAIKFRTTHFLRKRPFQ